MLGIPARPHFVVAWIAVVGVVMVAVALLATPVSARGLPSPCKPSSGEEAWTKLIQNRKTFLQNGTVAKWISTGQYSADTVELELQTDFITVGFDLYTTALQEFGLALSDKDPPRKPSLFSKITQALMGPLVSILNAAGKTFMNGFPVGTIVQGLFDVVKGLVDDSGSSCISDREASTCTNFREAAIGFYTTLQDRFIQETAWREELADNIRNQANVTIRNSMLMFAYNLTTSMMETLPNSRVAFLSYLSQYALERWDFPATWQPGSTPGTDNQPWPPMFVYDDEHGQTRWGFSDFAFPHTVCTLPTNINNIFKGCLNVLDIIETCNFAINSGATDKSRCMPVAMRYNNYDWVFTNVRPTDNAVNSYDFFRYQREGGPGGEPVSNWYQAPISSPDQMFTSFSSGPADHLSAGEWDNWLSVTHSYMHNDGAMKKC